MIIKTIRRRESVAFYAFTGPWLVGLVGLTLGPILASLALSFTNWNMFSPPHWVGFENYVKTFKTPMFWTALYNTAYYSVISVPLSILIALVLAVLLNQKVAARRWFRTAFYLPSTIPVVAVVMLWSWLLAPAGLFNEFLHLFGIHGPAWFVDPAWIKPGLIIMSLWGAGGGTVLFLAGLQGIPSYLYEAAELDGASSWTKFVRITMPQLSPIILFNLINGIIGAMQVFTQVYIIGTNNASTMMVPYLFEQAFQNYQMGLASATAWLLFIIIMVLTLIVLKWSSVWVYYEGERR
ncbi:sugar ABC transporter permease [Alicyclobacillus fastidiosus]|uniref:Sugar ABC transporter permease n=1 Tax=Alicyclobacillus fastidiosus TaxID=392011 RepID=A0ABY6ZM61_9BACL|nr:sugar ABC transporter permease [Alicyclobacillus fastidiosus]WAH43936.1 sugar ABC transporter permease [Alicyclobacillus fastidiosus]GMA60189.1 spermidine/putrescine ABC transporter permease [Alicyclobacillus fastidiosus]